MRSARSSQSNNTARASAPRSETPSSSSTRASTRTSSDSRAATRTSESSTPTTTSKSLGGPLRRSSEAPDTPSHIPATLTGRAGAGLVKFKTLSGPATPTTAPRRATARSYSTSSSPTLQGCTSATGRTIRSVTTAIVKATLCVLRTAASFMDTTTSTTWRITPSRTCSATLASDAPTTRTGRSPTGRCSLPGAMPASTGYCPVTTQCHTLACAGSLFMTDCSTGVTSSNVTAMTAAVPTGPSPTLKRTTMPSITLRTHMAWTRTVNRSNPAVAGLAKTLLDNSLLRTFSRPTRRSTEPKPGAPPVLLNLATSKQKFGWIPTTAVGSVRRVATTSTT